MDESRTQKNLAKLDQLLLSIVEPSENHWSQLITNQLVRLYARLADVLEASDPAAYALEKLSREPDLSAPGILYFPVSALEKELIMIMEADEEILNLGSILDLILREAPELQSLLGKLSIDTRDWTVSLTIDLLGRPNTNRWPVLMRDTQFLTGDRQTESGSLSIHLPIEVEGPTTDVGLVLVNFGEVDYREQLDRSIQYFTSRKQLTRIRSSREYIKQMILRHATSEKILSGLSPRTKIRSLI